MLDERAAATVLAAIVTGIAWAQSDGFNLWSIGAALPTKIDVPSQELSVSTSSDVASPLDAEARSTFTSTAQPPRARPSLQISREDPSTTSPVYRSLNSANDYFEPGQIFNGFPHQIVQQLRYVHAR